MIEVIERHLEISGDWRVTVSLDEVYEEAENTSSGDVSRLQGQTGVHAAAA